MVSKSDGRMPVVFFGHGTPMHAIADNRYTRAWAAMGETLPKPRAIVMVSAHWYTQGTGVTAMERPRTIHDFGGFPRALHDVVYNAPGDPALARHVADLLAPAEIHLDQSWGFDHGTWSVLGKAYPDADIPIVQLSIDGTLPPRAHFERGRLLAPLRDEGVLIAASGNIVHNFDYMSRAEDAPVQPFAARFDADVRDRLLAGDWESLIDVAALGPDAAMSVPTPDHYLPFVYALGAATPGDNVSFPVEGIDLGSMSMRSVIFGDG